MDNDRKIPLKFLDESEDCCDRIEATVLGLANTIPNPQELDEVLRAAHSVKGGAAMMGFIPLSNVAHQLEEFFKILRVRYHSKSISTDMETLLLQGVDCLRMVGDLHRQGGVVDEQWLATQSQPIFDRLRQHLGDLRPEDEDALLSQEGDIDPGILLFESGVKEALDLLEVQIENLAPIQLRQELQATANELSDFGRMAKLDRFVELCQSVKSQSQNIEIDRVISLTHQAIKVWRKSHSVVLLGRFDKIPTQLTGVPAPKQLELVGVEAPTEDFFNSALFGRDEPTELESIDLALFHSEIVNLELEEEFSLELEEIQLPSELLSELAAFDLPEFPDTFESDSDDNIQFGLTDLLIQTQAPTELLSELAAFDLPEFSDTFESNWDDNNQSSLLLQQEPSLELLSELANIELPELPTIRGNDDQVIAPTISTITPSTPTAAANRQTVRVPVEYLHQFNNVFGQLILERNAIDLRLKELQNYTGLMRNRMQHLESSNQELRQWYDRAATEGMTPTAATNSPQGFDSLEMDRYNDLHLVSQNQIETIVKLQEVTADIELSLQEMTRSVSSLNQTTRTLQKNVTRTQMLPFADVVKRFPRLIRDLSLQFGKSVNLKIVGEHTGIDRAILEQLNDPLIHLLRNAFDHGIEDPATRLAAGKSAAGSIVLTASQRSGETVITIADDGGGINLDQIRDRLQQIGLPAAEVAKIPETQLLDTIFEPGFSTAASLTELSGRGVGMDVVRTNIEQIRGNISVKTQPGVGTTFTIRVPFSLSIVRVMLLERAGFVFAVSVDSVKEIIDFQPQLATVDGTQISWQSQVIPLIALEQGISFGRNHRSVVLPGNPTISQPTVLVVGEDNSATAFKIDRFWGEREVTMRSIDSPIPLTPGFGHSIILGDGRVVPLIDLVQFGDWILATPPTCIAEIEPINFAPTQTSAHQILVIDDSINVRRYLAAMLEKEGYQVEQAKDGQEAVEKLFAGLRVQAAICDIEMPRLDGYGVLETLRSDPDFEDLPILMLTSRTSEKHRMLAMNLGASAYFSKPYIEPELLAKLKSLISHLAPIQIDYY